MTEDRDRDLKRFRRLLRLYPPAFRERYGPEMEAFFLRELRESGPSARFWMRLSVDHATSALAIRRRERKGGGVMEGWLTEVRVAGRSLRRAPMYTAFSVITIALGIAATTAAFTVLDRVVLRPLPYPDSDRLVIVGSEFPHDPGGLGPLSPTQLLDMTADPGPAEIVVGITFERRTILGLGEPERLNVKRVGSGFFELLGARPHVGRLIDDADQQPGAAGTVVIGYGLWRDRFGGDSGVVGRTLTIDGEVHAIVGVLSRDFVQPDAVAEDGSIWAAARYAEGQTSAGAFGITALARLPEGVAPEAMERYVDARFPQQHGFLLGGMVRNYLEHEVGDVASRLRSVLGGVALLLLIALVNVASLMLTRARAKERELSVRAALGAGRARLLRGLLTEAGLLTLAGGVAGCLLAVWVVEVFRANAPAGIPRLAEVAVDGTGIAAVALLTLFVMLTAGFAPALWAARSALAGAVGSSRSVTWSRGDQRARRGLVLAETALAVVLVVGSGLLANDLIRLSSEDRGFRAGGITSMTLDLAGRAPERASLVDFWSRLLEDAGSIPGVSGAAVTSLLPYDGVSTMYVLVPEGRGEESFIVTATVSADYFDVMGIPVAEGRALTGSEIETGEAVVVVNEAFVREYWPGEDPLGRTVADGGASDEDVTRYTVVGVVGDVRTRPGTAAPPQVFFGLRSAPRAGMELVVRTVGDGPAPVAALRQAVWDLEPNLPIGRVASIGSIATGTLDRARFYAALFGGFAVLALVLALVGVYGTTAYTTRSRAREIGIRLVLGARREEVVREVLRSTGIVLGAGVVVGLTVAAVASRAMAEVLLYVTPRDVVTYVGVGVIVLATGVLAAAQPAIRSTRVDPITTLREE